MILCWNVRYSVICNKITSSNVKKIQNNSNVNILRKIKYASRGAVQWWHYQTSYRYLKFELSSISQIENQLHIVKFTINMPMLNMPTLHLQCPVLSWKGDQIDRLKSVLLYLVLVLVLVLACKVLVLVLVLEPSVLVLVLVHVTKYLLPRRKLLSNLIY